MNAWSKNEQATYRGYFFFSEKPYVGSPKEKKSQNKILSYNEDFTINTV